MSTDEMSSLWDRIEDITDGNVNMRHDPDGKFRCTLNGHEGGEGATAVDALTALANTLPATAEEYQEERQKRWEQGRKDLEAFRASLPLPVSPPDPNALPSEIEIGLGRGKLGDYLQRMVDAGWDIEIKSGAANAFAGGSFGGVSATSPDKERIEIDNDHTDEGTGDVEHDLALLYVRWKAMTA